MTSLIEEIASPIVISLISNTFAFQASMISSLIVALVSILLFVDVSLLCCSCLYFLDDYCSRYPGLRLEIVRNVVVPLIPSLDAFHLIS